MRKEDKKRLARKGFFCCETVKLHHLETLENKGISNDDCEHFFGGTFKILVPKEREANFPMQHSRFSGGGGVSYRCQCHGHLTKWVDNSHVYEGKHFLLMEPLEEE